MAEPTNELPNCSNDETLVAEDTGLDAGLGSSGSRSLDLEALFSIRDGARSLGRYLVLGTLGSGGMGTVLRAFDPKLDRRVAIKVLHRELSEQQTERLLREAQALARLSHPNVVQVYELGELDGRTFVVMELVEGQTLAQWLRATPPPSWRRCVEVFVQAGEGLAAAHERGLVHRDFKPGNAIIDEHGRVRVLDFGLARPVDGVDDEAATSGTSSGTLDSESSSTPLTRTGAVLGTPAYMPLEQMHGSKVDARSDQFSFCVSLYEAVYGERPFAGDSIGALIIAMTEGELRPAPAHAKAPSALRRALLRGLSIEPERRWPSMGALVAELQRLLAPRRWWLGVSIGAGLAALGVGLGYQAEVGQRCTGARAQLQDTWNDERKRELATTIMADGSAYAEGTWERVDARLAAYAEAWVAKHTEVCEATAVRREQSEEEMSLRMACLRERKTALHAVVKVLAQTDAEVLEHAVDLVAGLPDLSDCDDVERLQEQRQRLPPPQDDDVAREVETLREQLAEIGAEREAGRYARALDQVDPLIERVRALDYAPLVAEATLLRGRARDEAGQHTEAEQDLREAYALAAEHGHDALVLDAAMKLAFVVGYQQARSAEGAVWIDTAMPLARRSGDEVDLAECINNHAAVLLAQGRYRDAELEYRRALELQERVLGADHPGVAMSWNNLGVALELQGKHAESEQVVRRALELRRRVLGEEHPSTAHSMHGLAHTIAGQGRDADAELLLRQTIEIQERVLGKEHPHLAESYNTLGAVLINQGHLEEGEALFRRAVAIFEQSVGEDHPDLARALGNLSFALSSLDRRAEAEPVARRALDIRLRVLGEDHPEVAHSWKSLGTMLTIQDRFAEAEPCLRRALQLREQELGAEHPDLSWELEGLSDALRGQGKLDEAESLVRRALALRERALGADHPAVADASMRLAMIALERGEHEGARDHAERALSIREAGAMPPDYVASARFLLARTLWPAATERVRARALAEQSRRTYESIGDAKTTEHDEVIRWLAEHPVR
ncbi:serine/threonine-protein kinase [Paraliomyxa miuraensis]|uniref:serine/threonine-protein kinase n=1 Tax=Paraliomyxa miuraensis TaxID=376150 RepID=UPI00225B53F1|nr:serine/threonine-protein kinase [Paraliomyxa miuraensis]MCX4241628.1 tetratricopeptide repeat protein [Paraliomyxa miuraensis]